MTRADLQYANLTRANLKGASLRDANVRGVKFEPRPLKTIAGLVGIRGLSNIQLTNVNNVMNKHKMFNAAGFKTEEKALTSALRKHLLSFVSSLEKFTWSVLFGGLLTDYGTKLLRPLAALLIICSLFIWPYFWALWKQDKTSGMLRISAKDCLLKVANKSNQELVCGQNVWRSLALALYVSFHSAFHFGWSELKVSNRAVRILKCENTLSATGWVRIVSGMQSVISLYLVLMWLMVYFGNP